MTLPHLIEKYKEENPYDTVGTGESGNRSP